MLNKVWRKLRYISRLIVSTPYFGWILLTQAVSGAASFVGLPVLIPVLEFMRGGQTADGGGGLLPFVVKPLQAMGIEPSFHVLLVSAGIFIIAGQVLVSVSSLIAAFARERLLRSYRERIFNRYLTADWLWLTESRSGGVFYAVIQEAQLASEAHLSAQRVLINFFQVFVFLAIAMTLSFPVTLLALGIYAIIGLVSIINSSFVYRIADRYNLQLTAFSNVMTGFQQNRKFFKTSLLGGAFIKKILDLILQVSRSYKRQYVHMEFQRMWSMVATSAFLLLIIFFHEALSLDYATLLVILLIFFRIAPQFTALATIYAVLDSTMPMHRSLQRHLGELEAHQEDNGGQSFCEDKPIRFTDVVFSYPAGGRVLDGLNMVVEPRTTVAIVGGSGAGKSTVLDLILRLISPQEGAIYYGEVPHGDLDKRSLRKKIAYVTQQPSLLDGTLRENLTVANPVADEALLEETGRRAHILDFVGQWPRRWDTVIGENGIKLSGGQRQRVAIARALLTQPKLLILDEATSELDSESERMIQDTIQSLKDHLTIVMVAHRLSTVKTADVIYVLEDGRICEAGTYQELLARKGKFYLMDSLQK